MEKQILKLRDDQIMALFWLVGVRFEKKYFEDIIKEIRTNKEDSQYLGILIDEADSKNNLSVWISYFEKENKKNRFWNIFR
ncbi:MAG TPA: hypothetical protein PKG74_01015 [Candidatus Colwellbacteria bacterium]|nr:hypothetical protein [Candidatus Colwellbacteria bacterium]